MNFQTSTSCQKGFHTVVIGGSIAGLLADRILTNHFERVTIVERDSLPQSPSPRPGTSQTYQFYEPLTRSQ